MPFRFLQLQQFLLEPRNVAFGGGELRHSGSQAALQSPDVPVEPRKSRFNRRHDGFSRFRLPPREPKTGRIEIAEVAVVIGKQPGADEEIDKLRSTLGRIHPGAGEKKNIPCTISERLNGAFIFPWFGWIKPDGEIGPGPASILRPQRVQFGDGSEDGRADLRAFELPLQLLALSANDKEGGVAKPSRHCLRKT